jgi:hypothetical protein
LGSDEELRNFTPFFSAALQVPQCNVGLDDAKPFNRRFRICPAHAMMPSVTLDGKRQRFCQQCSRFQGLGEFEGAHKSCARMLRRHRDRRRAAKGSLASGGAGSASDGGPAGGTPARPRSSSSQDLHWEAPQEESSGSGAAWAVPLEAPGAHPALPVLLGGGDQLWPALPPPLSEDALFGVEGLQAAAAVVFEPEPTADLVPAAMAVARMAAAPGVGYSPQAALHRVSLKVFSCTPDVLLPAVRTELEALVGGPSSLSLVEGCIRPGCVHLTLDTRALGALGARPPAPGGLAAAVARLAARGELGGDMMVQAGGRMMVLARGGRVVAQLDLQHAAHLVPRLAAVRPLAVVAAPRAALRLQGQRISDVGDAVMCRQQGRNLVVEMLPAAAAGGGGGGGGAPPSALEALGVGVLGLAAGCAEVEVQRGAFLGAARPLLVLPPGQGAAAAEVRQLEGGGPGAAVDVDALLRDAGVVVQWLERGGAASQGLRLPSYTPQLLESLQGMASGLAACAVARGWAATAALLLPATTAAGQSGAAAVAEMDAACPASLLHAAVASGRADVVQALAAWARGAGATAALAGAMDAKAEGGVTPLHVAAMLPAARRDAMLGVLRSLSPAVDKLWGLACADDGSTPEALAAGGGVAAAAPAAAPSQQQQQLAAQVQAQGALASGSGVPVAECAQLGGAKPGPPAGGLPAAAAGAGAGAGLRAWRALDRPRVSKSRADAIAREVAGGGTAAAPRSQLAGAALVSGAALVVAGLHALGMVVLL